MVSHLFTSTFNLTHQYHDCANFIFTKNIVDDQIRLAIEGDLLLCLLEQKCATVNNSVSSLKARSSF